MSVPKDQIDQDALAAEWGLALEADATNAVSGPPPEGGPPDGSEGPGEHFLPTRTKTEENDFFFSGARCGEAELHDRAFARAALHIRRPPWHSTMAFATKRPTPSPLEHGCDDRAIVAALRQSADGARTTAAGRRYPIERTKAAGAMSSVS